MKASFIRRIGAYVIDIIIISLIALVITSFLIPTRNIGNLLKEVSAAATDLELGRITIDIFAYQLREIYYSITYQLIGRNIITLLLYIMYFIIFQFKNNGQTIGKKLMKIRVVKTDNNSLVTMDEFVKRSLIINSLLVNMITLVGILTLKAQMYFTLIVIIGIIQFLIIVVSGFMVLYRRDGRGLQDLFAGTKVVTYKGE